MVPKSITSSLRSLANGHSIATVNIAITLCLVSMLAAPSVPVTAQPTTQTAPILLVTNSSYSANPFGAYLGEILRAEGLNEYDQIDLSNITTPVLAQYPVIILAETSLTAPQAALFTTYGTGGGSLIAMRPDPRIASLFGLGPQAADSPQSDGYLKIDPAITINGEFPGLSLSADTLQIHGLSDLYTYTPTQGLSVVAWLYSNATTPTPYPAVVAQANGTGWGMAFTYDLARNVVYTRQGNPANANVDVDNDGVIRTTDLFQKTGGGAGWADLNKLSIPQSDMQQRLLAHLVKELASKSEPLPQLWYFPGNALSMLIMTGDAHANPYQPPNDFYQPEIDSINQYHGQMTMGLSVGEGPTCSQVQSWAALGNTFGLHPYSYHPDPVSELFVHNLLDGFRVANKWFQLNINNSSCNVPLSKVVRIHQGAWAGWTDAADYEASYGISMDTSFYTFGPWLQNVNGSWAHGYMTGSGQPMKFIHADGTIASVYQQATQLVDEQLVLGTDSSLEALNGNQALVIAKNLMDNSLQGGYSAIVTQNDVDFYRGDPQVWAEGMMDYANSKSIPVWNADKWASFTANRHDASYTNMVWDKAQGTLSFDLISSPGIQDKLTTMIPLKSDIYNLYSVVVDGVITPISQMNVENVNYGFISLTPGIVHHFVVTYLPCSGNAAINLNLTYQGQPSLIAGNQIVYTLAAKNDGPTDAFNVNVIDLLPVGIKSINIAGDPQWSCTYSSLSNIVTCNYSNIFSQAKTSTIVITVQTPATPTTLLNRAAITSDTCNLTGNNPAQTLTVNTLFGLYLPITHQ